MFYIPKGSTSVRGELKERVASTKLELLKKVDEELSILPGFRVNAGNRVRVLSVNVWAEIFVFVRKTVEESRIEVTQHKYDSSVFETAVCAVQFFIEFMFFPFRTLRLRCITAEEYKAWGTFYDKHTQTAADRFP